MHGDEDAAVPARGVGGVDDDHAGPLGAFVLGDGEEDLARAPRLREDQVGSVGEVVLVVADLGGEAVDRSVEADVNALVGGALVGDVGVLHHAGGGPDFLPVRLARGQQEIIAGFLGGDAARHGCRRRGGEGHYQTQRCSLHHRIPSFSDDGFLKSSGMWNMYSALFTLSMV